MANIKVETFDIDVTTSGSTHTLTNSVGTTAKAFIRRPGPSDKAGGGPTGSTADATPSDVFMGIQLTGVTQLTFNKATANSMKIIGEVWRYTGAAAGVDEFIVRGHYAITLSGTTASQAVASITTEDKCVPFISGINNPNTSVNDYDGSTVAAHMDGSGNVVVSRGVAVGTLTVYVSVVEFTGVNWTIGHGISSTHDTALEVVTLNTASDGISGSTFNVPSWENAFIEMSMEGDTVETGLSDVLASVYPNVSLSEVSFKLHQDTAAKNDGDGWIHVIAHQGLVVNRASNLNLTEGNGTYGTLSFPAGASTARLLDELALESFTDTSGTGTAHARGRLNCRITAASGTIQHWVHRSGNNVSMYYGVIELLGVDGTTFLSITDIDTDEIVGNNQLNVIITGNDFGATQGTGKVELVQNNDYSGTIISQSIDSWSNTSIQIDIVSGLLADTNCFLYVTSDAGARGFFAIQVGVPPETYKEAIQALTPAVGRYWTFQNTYNEEVGGANFNNVTSGSPVFVTSPLLCRGDSHSHELDGTTADMHIETADITEINASTQDRRYMGGWIMFDSVQKVLAVIYEEGAQVNNIALLVGFGNIVMVQVADTGDDYAQAYTDIKLTPNRAYHVMFKFEASAYDAEVRIYLDGILQAKSNGNPWTATNLDSHTGNISMGHQPGESLQVGDSNTTDNVDIQFATATKCYYAHWVNWSGAVLTATQIREQLFEKGARADVTISSDTEAAMQTALDAYADTVRPDVPLAIRIEECTAGDFELTADNITFNSRASIQVQYFGGDTLTWVNENGSETDSNKLSTPYSGTITIINAPAVTITVKDAINGATIQNARVLVEASSGGDLAVGADIVTGLTDVNGEITTNHRYTSDQPVTGIARKGSSSPFYKQGDAVATILNTGLNLTILMIRDE